MNFIRAICQGTHSGFGSREVNEQFPMGSKSNITRIRATLLDREIIEEDEEGIRLADCVFRQWFVREFM